MNTKLASFLSVICFLSLLGCDKQAGSSDETSEQRGAVSAVPFNGESFRSFDGSMALTIISKDECEMRNGPDTLLCKYTRQDGALRVIVTQLGTNLVLYFRLVPEGLQGNHGNVLLNPLSYNMALKRVQEQRLAEQRAQEEAERNRMQQERRKREELVRIGRLIEESKVETKVVLRAAHLYRNYDSSQEYPGQLTIRNAYLNIFTKDTSRPSVRVWLGAIDGLSYDDLSLNKTLIIYGNFFAAAPELINGFQIAFSSAEKAAKFKTDLLSARDKWKRSFPQLSTAVLEEFFHEKYMPR